MRGGRVCAARHREAARRLAWQLTEALPEELQDTLPSPRELERLWPEGERPDAEIPESAQELMVEQDEGDEELD